ncbi:MAG: A24 family peptidase [Comamonadaceae bacterium]|nr:A24 family peptidase [Comamonadaceae bacterium]
MDMTTGSEVAMAALLGLLIGSFLNVVVHRLPQMMEQQWATECAQHAASQSGQPYAPPAPALTLSRPRSRCPHCSQTIGWKDNIPVLSWLLLRGRCRSCQQRISMRYPLVELATAALFAWCIARWGFTPAGWAWSGFGAALLALALIDWDTTYLPDSITLPLVWAGLLACALGWTGTGLNDAVWGAAAGYLSLWSIYWLFKLVTGKEGMGYGDFKLFAALGAWLGWQALVPMMLMASVIGAVIGIFMKLRNNLREGGYLPFGPFLAGAGFAAMLFGAENILAVLLHSIGI